MHSIIKNSRINKISDNILLIADGRNLFTYDTLNENTISVCEISSIVNSIKIVEQTDN